MPNDRFPSCTYIHKVDRVRCGSTLIVWVSDDYTNNGLLICRCDRHPPRKSLNGVSSRPSARAGSRWVRVWEVR